MVDSRNRRKATDARQHSRKFRRRGQVQIPPSFAKASEGRPTFAEASAFAKPTADETAGGPPPAPTSRRREELGAGSGEG